jgi:hypothetical protein
MRHQEVLGYLMSIIMALSRYYVLDLILSYDSTASLHLEVLRFELPLGTVSYLNSS